MQRLIEVKRRMRTIEEIRGVARTMATVASAKLSRTRLRASGMRVYADRMRETLRRQQRYVAEVGVPIELVSPFFVTHPARRVLLVHLAGDRGMCGNYNMAVNRLALDTIEKWREQDVEVLVAVRGSKGEHYLRRKGGGVELADVATWPRTGVDDDVVDHLHTLATRAFLERDADEVWCTYTRFYTPLRREPRLVRLLPIAFETPGADAPAPRARGPERWWYEPRFSAVVDELVRAFVRIQCEDVLLESYASEQGARMITMEEATERAGKRLQECRVLYNRLRREFITTDLLSVLFASRARHAEENTADG